MRFLPLLALAGCIGIPGPAANGGDPDAAPGPETVTCDRSLGELLPSPAFEGVASARDVMVADLDRDGLDDVIALLEPDRVAVARTRAEGGYATPVEVALDADLHALATLDLDGDSDLDVVAAGTAVVVLRNDAGTLVEEARQAAGCTIDVLVAGQFDDDVRPDVVVGCTASGLVGLMRHGDPEPLDAPVDIATFTGLRGAETPGALAPLTIPDVGTPMSLELGAIDDNPGADLVVMEGDEVNGSLWRTLVITSPLTDASVEPQPGGQHSECRLGRLDADSERDLACINPYGPLLVAVIHGGAVPAVTRSAGHAALLAQADYDPALEVLTIGALIEVLEPRGDELVVEASNPSGYPPGEPLALLDWTDDGRPDLLMHTFPDADGAIEIRPGTGIGVFGEPILVADEAWNQLAVGDLDNDTYADIVGWTYPSTSVTLHVAFGGFGGGFVDNIVRSGLRSIAIADVIEGGAPELIAATSENEIQIIDASERTLEVVMRVSAGAFPLQAVASDLDGDGDQDLVTLEVVSGDNETTYARTYIHGANDAFFLESSHPMRGWNSELVVADVDGDSAPDVLAGGVLLLRGQGDGRVAPPVPFVRPSRFIGTVRAPAGAADQLIYVAHIAATFDSIGTVEMLAPGCR